MITAKDLAFYQQFHIMQIQASSGVLVGTQMDKGSPHGLGPCVAGYQNLGGREVLPETPV
jgi:hypothetical protein